MSPPFTIRRASEFDAQAMARLAGELGYPTDAKAIGVRIRAVLESPADSLLVAVDSSDVPVGWLQAHRAHLIESGYVAEILGLIVSPQARRAGIGRGLVAEAERWATSIGAEAIVVRSNITREESHAFYPALGYQVIKMQRVYRKVLTDGASQ